MDFVSLAAYLRTYFIRIYLSVICCVQSESTTFTNVFTYSYRGSHVSATRHHFF